MQPTALHSVFCRSYKLCQCLFVFYNITFNITELPPLTMFNLALCLFIFFVMSFFPLVVSFVWHWYNNTLETLTK